MYGNILLSVDFRQVYEAILGKTLPREDSGTNVKVKCPFHKYRLGHDDDSPSLSIALGENTGGKYNCLGCGSKGNLITFVKDYHNFVHGEILDFREQIHQICKYANIDPSSFDKSIIDDKKIAEWQDGLYTTESGKKVLEHLTSKRCLSDRVVRAYRLGWDDEKQVVTIPITDGADSIVDVRLWHPEYLRTNDFRKQNKIRSLAGHGGARLFPYQALREDEIILCEGELDCLALWSLGFNAITGTTGANNFELSWVRFFANKDIVILYDCDAAGRNAADKVTEMLYQNNRTLKIVYLKPEETNYDVTDYIYELGAEARESLRALINRTDDLVITSPAGAKLVDDVNLFKAANAQYVGKNIRLTATVAGKEEASYGPPLRVKCTCDKGKNMCKGCPLQYEGKQTKEITLEADDPLLIEYAKTSPAFWDPIHAKVCKVTGGRSCNAQFQVVEHLNLEEVRIIPSLDYQIDQRKDEDTEWTIREAYVAAHGLKLNSTYEFVGKTCIHPKTAQITHIFSDASVKNSFETSVETFDIVEIDGVNQSVYDHLQIFQPTGWRRNSEGFWISEQTAHNKLMEIYKNLEMHVTKVVGRRDLLQALDLTWHSPLKIALGKEPPVKGAIDTLVCGDSQCGKSASIEKLRDHYRCGAILDGGITSFVGLVGGYIDLTGGKRRFVLGQIPLNAKKLVIIDEVQDIPEFDFKKLTSTRSSGQVRANKQAMSNEFHALVRMVMIGNPRSGKGMSSRNYGCEAVAELAGDEADLARFDICLTVAKDEVRIDEINTQIKLTEPLLYNSDLCSLLLRWVWGRQTSDWEFTEPAIKAILDFANLHAQTYDPSIMIVSPASHRYKIARVAAAIAARLFSTDEQGHKVIVTEDHVDAAVVFLDDCYTKPSMNYHIYSQQRKRMETLPYPDKAKQYFDELPVTLIEFLQDTKAFQKHEFVNGIGVDEHLAKEAFKTLQHLRVIETAKSGGRFKATTGFLKFIDAYKHPDPENKKVFKL